MGENRPEHTRDSRKKVLTDVWVVSTEYVSSRKILAINPKLYSYEIGC